jgi:hypothetical protein
MKAKPNTDQFRHEKDPSAFLEGGSADAAALADRVEKKPVAIAAKVPTVQVTHASAKVHREQKVFRLPLDLINALKRESYERSMNTGSRVTETELVELALRSFLDI